MDRSSLRNAARKACLVLAFFCAGGLLVIYGNQLELGSLAAAFAILFILFVFITHALSGPKFSLLDPGIFFAFVVLIYTAIPVGAFAIIGLTLTAFADNRLLSMDIRPENIHLVAQTSIAAFVGFGTTYLSFRKFEGIARQSQEFSDPVSLGVAFATSSAILLIVGFIIAQRAGGYADEYVFYRELPVLLVQFLNINAQLFVLSVFAIVYCLLAEKRLLACAAVLGSALLISAIISSSRTNLFLLVLGSAAIYDRVHARIRLRAILPAVAAGLFLFLTLGIFRIGTTVRTDTLTSANIAERVSTGSEFMAVFATDLDIVNLKAEGLVGSAVSYLYITDVLKLIPQQILPIDKFDPAQWYVNTFYYDAATHGAGFAFGMTAESLLGGGPSDGLARGLLLGLLIATIFNYLGNGRRQIWKEVFAAWLFVNLYQCFRDTTFTILPRGLTQFLPAVLLLVGIAALIRTAGRNRSLATVKRRAPLSIESARPDTA